MKKLLFILGLFISLGVNAQIDYPTNVFWRFIEGFQAGDSTTSAYFEYKNGVGIFRTPAADTKILQFKNDISDVGITNVFSDVNKNGGIGVDSSNGETTIKLRGAPTDHSYILNSHFSIGRSGATQAYGGTIDGAKFTVNCGDRNPLDSLGNAGYYQMMVQNSGDTVGQGAGIAFNNESATKDINVGGAIVYEKLGNNGYGALNFYAKNSVTDFAAPTKLLRLGGDTVNLFERVNFPLSNSDGTGIIYQGGYRFITSDFFGTTSNADLFIGIGAGNLSSIGSGKSNIGIGSGALDAYTTGSNNIAIGNNVLGALTTGSENVVLGMGATFLTDGSYNVMIGSNFDPSPQTTSGSYNVYLGRSVGVGNEDYKLRIDNNTAGDDLIEGDFDVDTLRLNATVTVRDTLKLETVATGTSDTVLTINDGLVEKKELVIETGTYTPTITDSLNIDGSEEVFARYSRVGNFVDVWVSIRLKCTTYNTYSIIAISLPIASDFTLTTDAMGSGSHFVTEPNLQSGISPRVGTVFADTTINEAIFNIRPNTSGNQYAIINFTYEIK